MTLKPVDLLAAQRLPLFQNLDPTTFAQLMNDADLRSVARGVQLVAEGEVADSLHILIEGSVELEAGWNERHSTLALLRPLATIALASVVLEAPALMNARTITRCKVLTMPGAALRYAARRDTTLAYGLAEELSGCYSSVVRALKNNKLRGAQDRLSNYLLAQQTRQGGQMVFKLPCQKRILASLLGMTPENLSRAFASLAVHGVTVNGAVVTLARRSALSRLAKPATMIDGAPAPGLANLGQAERERRRCGVGANAAALTTER